MQTPDINLIEKIENLAATPGIESETALLLKMAAEAQKTGKMPALPSNEVEKMNEPVQPRTPAKCPDCYGTGYEEIDHGHYPCPRGCKPNTQAQAPRPESATSNPIESNE